MNTTFRSILIVTVIVVIAGALFLGGMAYARINWGMMGFGRGWMMSNDRSTNDQGPYSPGRSGGGMMNRSYGSGMMGGYGSGSLYSAKPLSVEEAKKSVDGYLSGIGNEDLKLDEIMIFDNNAYARIVEKSTNIGAFEVLVDPVTLAVSPEPGPNMMWNQKYGMLSGSGMMGMMSNYGYQGGGMGRMGRAGSSNASTPMPVGAEDAIQSAQRYLDTYMPGVKTGDSADAFYGYYTIDFQRDGKIVGMLSVNGYSRQVFLHTWHGTFIEMSEE